jgi:hypothetical protein
LRSRRIDCAFLGSFQSDGSSASAFSSSSFLRALSQSKKPPQKIERLLDFGGEGGDFGAHKDAPIRMTACGYEMRARLASPLFRSRDGFQ